MNAFNIKTHCRKCKKDFNDLKCVTIGDVITHERKCKKVKTNGQI